MPKKLKQSPRDEVAAEIEQAMARAFFASAWSELQGEKDADDPTRVNLQGKEILDVMPKEIDPAALHAARTLVMDMERVNCLPFVTTLIDVYVLARARRDPTADRTMTPELFGHYCAMQAMGHGVGLDDAFGPAVYDAIQVPYVEFGSYALERDY